MFRTLLSVLILAAAAPALEARVPPRMVSNIYLLAQAGAMLDVCAASPDAPSFPPEKSREIAAVSDRLTKLVGSIGAHYGDAGLPTVYSATKAQIASDTKLKFHVKSNHGYCNERFMGEIKAYVSENEALIGNHLAKGEATSSIRR
ncbi:MAG TPA: hypothetical protein VM073_06230 [Usitatibacter sp.]|nr:hypothetical protein [Usitatibacter sp.]